MFEVLSFAGQVDTCPDMNEIFWLGFAEVQYTHMMLHDRVEAQNQQQHQHEQRQQPKEIIWYSWSIIYYTQKKDNEETQKTTGKHPHQSPVVAPRHLRGWCLCLRLQRVDGACGAGRRYGSLATEGSAVQRGCCGQWCMALEKLNKIYIYILLVYNS